MNQADPSLLAIFSAEQAEHVSAVRSLLDRLAAGDSAALDGLLRHLHTLKGAARAVGIGRTELLAHEAEEVLAQVRRGAVQSIETVRRALDRTMDLIEDILAAALEQKNAPDASDALEQLALLSGKDLPASSQPEPEPAASDTAPPAAAPSDLLRINASGLDELIRESSELLIDSNAETSHARLSAYASHLDEVSREWGRLRRTSTSAVREFARNSEFQPIAECLSFVDSRLAALNREVRAVHETSGNNARSLRDRATRVYQGACRIRTTPAEAVFGGFGPMVRDLAKEEGKQIMFRAEGLDTYADLLVLQGLKDSVMHLLRNAVSHGIESPDQRVRAGKPEEGTIRLALTSRGDRLLLTIEDDGRGLDYQGVEREARRRGLVSTGAGETNAEEMARLVFEPGFSTSREVTGVSGRGIGLSIVQTAVNRLRGEITIVPRSGGGTRVILSVPISISTQHVLLVAAGGHTFAVSTSFVESLRRVKPSEVRNVNGRESIVTGGAPVALMRLTVVLGIPDGTAPDAPATDIPCVILNLEGKRAAVAVDRMVDEREAIIKDTGLPGTSDLTAGAIPMEDGSVAVVLNVNGLLDSMDQPGRAPVVVPAPPKRSSRKARILVVDDSLTTRSLEKSILEAHGYDVKLAVDGQEALERLHIEIPDLVISDVLMPRLTGFQLLEKMKSDDALKNIPVILVTSLESREEQHQGLSLGADAYIVKRKFDQRELLNLIQEII